jgi:NADH dehydrogenase
MLTPPDRILVVGATGMLGKPVADRLADAGFTVRVLSRTPERARALFPASVEVVAGDVADPAALDRALADCAGVHINLKGGPTAAEYDRIEHQGTRTVAQAARRAGVQRLTYLSSYTIGANTAHSPESRAKALAETAIRASGVPYTIFRATWFMETLPQFVQGRSAIMLGRQPNPLHWLAAADYAAMVARSYAATSAHNQVFYIYGPEPLTMRAALQRYLDAQTPHVPIRTLPLRLSAALARVTRNSDLSDLTTLMAYYNRNGETGDPGPAQALLGRATTTLDDWLRQGDGMTR